MTLCSVFHLYLHSSLPHHPSLARQANPHLNFEMLKVEFGGPGRGLWEPFQHTALWYRLPSLGPHPRPKLRASKPGSFPLCWGAQTLTSFPSLQPDKFRRLFFTEKKHKF